MWCYKHNIECNSLTCNCDCCPYEGVYYNPSSQFNYECPDCHGKFNYPIYKDLEGTTEFRDRKPVCPFCERIMKGL